MQQTRDGSFVPAIILGALSQPVTMFGWTCLDGIEVPFVQRDGQKFFPVRIAEQKFLSQFTNVVKYDVQNPLSSYYMHAPEALALTNSECGEIFTVQDLLVNLEEFARFYEEVKEKCSNDCRKKSGVDGGWVQINNTVVPYIVKDDSVMISLAIVRCAAGLLVGRDVPVVYPDKDECRFLNDSCKSAGIAFDFTTSTELVELVLVSCMCNERPFIRQLPSGNPFAVAQPVVEDCSNTISTIDGVCGAQPIHVLPDKALSELPPPYPGVACNQQPWLANGSHSTGIQVVDRHSLLQHVSEHRPVPTAVHVSAASSHLQFLAAEATFGRTDYLQSGSDGSENQPPYQNPVVNSALECSNSSSKQVLKEQWKHSGVLQEYANNENASPVVDQLRQFVTDVGKKNTQMIVSDASKAQSLEHDRTTMPNILRNNTLIELLTNTDGTKKLHESATDEEKQMQICKKAQVPLDIVPDSDDLRAGDSLMLRRIECYGKTITCMVKHDKLYILLEAMNRLYFPMRRLDTVIKAVVEGLRVPVTTLTADEERDFMKFYKLPAEKLNSNKVISVDDFVGVYRSLQCMLDNSFFTSQSVDPKTTVESPAAEREGLTHSSIPVPVGLPVKNVSNTKVRQSRVTSTKANNHHVGSSDCLSNAGQSPSLKRKRMEKKFVKEMPKMAAIYENASDDDSGQKKPEICRMRVIGEVICIDD